MVDKLVLPEMVEKVEIEETLNLVEKVEAQEMLVAVELVVLQTVQ
jgi:hypothetical protein